MTIVKADPPSGTWRRLVTALTRQWLLVCGLPLRDISYNGYDIHIVFDRQKILGFIATIKNGDDLNFHILVDADRFKEVCEEILFPFTLYAKSLGCTKLLCVISEKNELALGSAQNCGFKTMDKKVVAGYNYVIMELPV